MHFDFVRGASENGRAATGTEKPPGVVARFAIDGHRILREHSGRVKKGAMMLAAVETVTHADPVWASRRHNSDVAAQATARHSIHADSPPRSSGRKLYNEPRRSVHESRGPGPAPPSSSHTGETAVTGRRLSPLPSGDDPRRCRR